MSEARDALIAWLHDPPDKVLQIRGHEARAARYLSAAIGADVSPEEIRGHGADHRASAIERLPVPHWQAEDRTTVVDADDLLVTHPLSAAHYASDRHPIPRRVDEESVTETIRALVEGVDSTLDRFWLLWRYLPDRLDEAIPGMLHLPADSRIPDHTIWQHLDTTCAVESVRGSSETSAFLAFSIGPVQPFIAAARSVRDLWSGSMILSWLTFHAMVPLLERFGPAVVIYPVLRANPLLDLWLRRKPSLADRVALPSVAQRKVPCLPNRFVALIPSSEIGQWPERVEQAARTAWREIASAVHASLDPLLRPLHAEWDRHWSSPIEDVFQFRSFALPWSEATDDAMASLLAGKHDFQSAFPGTQEVRALADAIPEADQSGFGERAVGQWQYRLELAARLAEADKAFSIPAQGNQHDETGPPMCSLTGATEQIGPARRADANRFWEEAARRVRLGGVRIRPGERLGSVALVKRFAATAFFADRLELQDTRELRFDDTATVAAAAWLDKATSADPEFDHRTWQRKGTWSGQWLHRTEAEPGAMEADDIDDACPPELDRAIKKATRSLGRAPSYYAVLMADGDRLGEWLRGSRSPSIRELIHPRLRDYYISHCGSPEGLDEPRPVTPAFHASLSQALANFALHFVPPIVTQDAPGSLIYAGGDDVLALLPTAAALDAACKLNDTYRAEWRADRVGGRQRRLMGRRATMSAGIAVVHHKSDLRWALDQARQAEHQAKDWGRNAVCITVARRSGEVTSAICPWSFVPTVQHWVGAFEQGASDRWAYRLRTLLETLQALPPAAVRSMVRRQFDRAEPDTRTKLGGTEAFVTEFDTLIELTRRSFAPDEGLRNFVLLCQTASFLARGTDR